MANELRPATAMVHYVCEICGMSATLVQTPVGDLAWLDHMANHVDPSMYRAYAWEVHRLPFDDV